MSKAQKGNKEKKKPKADKNQPKTHVSAYKAAQGQGWIRPPARICDHGLRHAGKMLTLRDSLARSAGSAWTTPAPDRRRLCCLLCLCCLL